MSGYKTRLKLRTIVSILTHYLNYHAFMISLNTKICLYDRCLEPVNLAILERPELYICVAEIAEVYVCYSVSKCVRSQLQQ